MLQSHGQSVCLLVKLGGRAKARCTRHPPQTFEATACPSGYDEDTSCTSQINIKISSLSSSIKPLYGCLRASDICRSLSQCSLIAGRLQLACLKLRMQTAAVRTAIRMAGQRLSIGTYIIRRLSTSLEAFANLYTRREIAPCCQKPLQKLSAPSRRCIRSLWQDAQPPGVYMLRIIYSPQCPLCHGVFPQAGSRPLLPLIHIMHHQIVSSGLALLALAGPGAVAKPISTTITEKEAVQGQSYFSVCLQSLPLTVSGCAEYADSVRAIRGSFKQPVPVCLTWLAA